MTQALIYSGGIGHPFAEAAQALVSILRPAGFSCDVSTDLDQLAEHLADHPAALLVVHALRWTMTQHEKYMPDRARWGMSPSPTARAALRAHLEAGGGLLGLHTASICFDDWPEWGELLGGRWDWAQSRHPPLGAVRVSLAAEHRLARGLPDFSLTDEAYCKLRLAAGTEVFGWVEAADGGGTTGLQPACWTHAHGRGCAVYISVGHDAASLQEPTQRRLLRRSALWATGHSNDVVEAA
jgi:type 1 glutamine amidotransferase